MLRSCLPDGAGGYFFRLSSENMAACGIYIVRKYGPHIIIHLYTMWQASASHNMVAGNVPSSHTKRPQLIPLAASVRTLSGVLFHRRRLGGTLFAVSNPIGPGEFICTKNQQLDAKLRFRPQNISLYVYMCDRCHSLPAFNTDGIGWTNTSKRR